MDSGSTEGFGRWGGCAAVDDSAAATSAGENVTVTPASLLAAAARQQLLVTVGTVRLIVVRLDVTGGDELQWDVQHHGASRGGNADRHLVRSLVIRLATVNERE